jgi:hypothetical protein
MGAVQSTDFRTDLSSQNRGYFICSRRNYINTDLMPGKSSSGRRELPHLHDISMAPVKGYIELMVNVQGRIRAGKFLSHLLPVANVSGVHETRPASGTYLQGRSAAGRDPGVSTPPTISLSRAKGPGFVM